MPKWNPHIPAFSSAHASSAASLALQKGTLSRSRTAAPEDYVQSSPPPSTPPEIVDPQLQKPVDPKLLLPSKSKGPPQRRQHPTKADRSKKVPSCCFHSQPHLPLTPRPCLSHIYRRNLCLSRWSSRVLAPAARDLFVIDLHHLSPNHGILSARNRLKSGRHFLKLSETF